MRHARPALAVAALLALITAAPAVAAPRMSAADRHAIGTLIDRFVKDNVLRQDLAAGWELAGPDLRGGTTRAAWIAGTGVTVEPFPARGTDFSHAWTGHLVEPGHAELSLILHPKPGSGYDETAATVDVRKLGGRWVVDLYYSAAVFRSGSDKHGSCGGANCAISGPNDFGPAGGGNPYHDSRINGHWLLIGLAALGGLVVVLPLALWLAAKRRERNARAAFAEAHPLQR